jgi:homocitrate synthase NifV
MKYNKRKINIVDTTLRDGQQSPGLAFSMESRERMVRMLDNLGVSRIEAVTPSTGEMEQKFIDKIKGFMKKTKLIVCNRLNMEEIKESILLEPHIVHICFPVSENQLTKKLKMTFREASSLLEEGVNLIKESSLEVSVELEDISRASKDRLQSVKELLLKLQVKNVRISDTVGILTPGRVEELVKFFNRDGFIVEFHAHNDLGMAIPNSLVAALSGASFIDTTLLGIGERAGNASLSGFIKLAQLSPVLELDLDLVEAEQTEDFFKPLLAREEYLENLVHSKTSDITDLVEGYAGDISL